MKGRIALGPVDAIECAATAADGHHPMAMLTRRDGETPGALLKRLDLASATFCDTGETTDAINKSGD